MRLGFTGWCGWSLISSVVMWGCTSPQAEDIASQAGQNDSREAGAGADGADGGGKPGGGAGADGSDASTPGANTGEDDSDVTGQTDDGSEVNVPGNGTDDDATDDVDGTGTDAIDPSGDDTTGSNPASTDTTDNGNSSDDTDTTTDDVLTHHCEDGNDVAGDGCGPDGIIEPGYTCVTPGCESEPCTIEVTATYRDFPESDPDFGFDTLSSNCGVLEGDPVPKGAVATQLDEDGRPVLANPDASACIESADSFARWYRFGIKKETTLKLYSNGEGGFVNRFGPNGEQLVVTQRTGNEYQVSGECDPGCGERVRGKLQCENLCRPAHDAVRARQDVVAQLTLQLEQLQAMLTEEQAAEEPDAELVAELYGMITETDTERDAAQLDVLTKTDEAAACDSECEDNFEVQVAECVADCKPCSFAPNMNCIGGTLTYFDGTPVFFPVDDITGDTSDLYPAQLADYYGYVGWPYEDEAFPGAPDHNFFFTTELEYAFKFDPTKAQVLRYTGDDDVWVFINGKLAVDLGGIHTPASDSVVLDAQAALDYGLIAGETYTIKVFHAERTVYGSSLMVTMPGSGGYSVCTKI